MRSVLSYNVSNKDLQLLYSGFLKFQFFFFVIVISFRIKYYNFTISNRKEIKKSKHLPLLTAVLTIIMLPCELGLSRKSWQKHKKLKHFITNKNSDTVPEFPWWLISETWKGLSTTPHSLLTSERKNILKIITGKLQPPPSKQHNSEILDKHLSVLK